MLAGAPLGRDRRARPSVRLTSSRRIDRKMTKMTAHIVGRNREAKNVVGDPSSFVKPRRRRETWWTVVTMARRTIFATIKAMMARLRSMAGIHGVDGATLMDSAGF